MSRSNRYSPELRERVVRIVFDRGEDTTSEWATVTAISTLLGMSLEVLGGSVRRAQVDQGARPGLTTDERGRLKVLEREVKDLRRTNAISQDASTAATSRATNPPSKTNLGTSP